MSFSNLFKQGDFKIDPNTPPEVLAAKRERLAALMPQYGRARYVGEGIGQLATGVASGIKSRKMDNLETEKRQEASDQYSSLMGGGGGGGGPLTMLGLREQPSGTPFTPPTEAEQIGSDAMAAIGQPRASGGGFPDSLVRTESGGNWNALNNEVGAGGTRGHGGRLQFGQARLEDAARAGVIPQMTPQQFAQASPQVQQAAENWHFSDIDKAIDSSGAAKMIGQSIGGVPVTRDGLRAVAHLGGAGGMQKFVQSGGEYNPSDSFGTSLMDYLGTHGGGTRSGGTQYAQNGPDTSGLMEALQNPWLSPQQRETITGLIGQRQKRDDATFDQQLRQQDPMYQAQLAQAQFDLGQSQQGLGGQAAKVQSSVVLDDGSTVMVMNDGQRRVLSPTGDEVSGQDAADAIRSARSYEVDNQREIYGGRREGTLGADIALGGQAKATEKVAEATVAAGVSAWEDYGKLQTSLGNIDEAIAALDSGAQSGLVYNMLPNVTEASASLENAMNRMGLDVVGSVTFGALSEGEMRLAMNTAVPQNLAPAELKSWLSKKRAAQARAAEMLANAAQFMTVPGNTINGWIEKNRTNKGPTAAPAAAPTPAAPEGQGSIDFTSDTPPEGLSPDDVDLWGFGTPEERQKVWGK